MSNIPKDLLDMMEADSSPIKDTPEKTAALMFEAGYDTRSAPVKALHTYPIKGTPKSHQNRAFNDADGNAGHCWWVDPGGGKTFLSIAEAGHLYNAGLIDGVIVLAPNGPHVQWITEQFPKWAGYPWHGAHNKQTPGQIKKFLERAPRDKMGVFSMNYDMVIRPTGEAQIERFMELYPRIYLVLDESHKIKDHRAKRTQEILKLCLNVTYRRLLSGTPILKGLEDLWTQYEACEPGLAWEHEPIRMGQRGRVRVSGFFGYRSHFCKLAPVPGNPRATRIVGYRNEGDLMRQVAGNVTRITADEFMLDALPDFISVSTPMNDVQRRHYRMMKEHLLAQMSGGDITAQNALVQMMKLIQIASGFLYPQDEETETATFGNNKIDATMNLVGQLNEPVIIWAPLRKLQDMLIEALREGGYDRHLFVYDPKDTDMLDRWRNDDNGLLLGNQGSGLGIGMNLQHAAANIYAAPTFSSEARWQSVKRTDRIGQTKQVRIWDLITPDTVEVRQVEALAAKEDISRRNIDGLKDFIS